MGRDAVSGTRRPLTWREVGVATAWFVVVAAIFLAPLFAGRSFSVVEARMADNHPWAAELDGRVDGAPAQFDSADLSVPWQHVFQGAIDEGTLAFWSADSFGGGAPLYANGTSAQLYPPRLLTTLVVPERWFHDVWVAIHLVAGGLAAFLLGRELSRSAAAALVGGTAWMLGSFNLGWAHLEVVTPMMVGVPLSLFLVHRAWRRRTIGASVVAAVGLAGILVSGHLLWMLFTWEMAAIYAGCLALARLWRDRPPRGVPGPRMLWDELWIPLLSFGGGLALAAVVLLPSLANLQRTPRTPFDVSALPSFLASGELFTRWLWWPPPHDPMNTDVLNGHLGFVGTATAFLAVVGLLSRRHGSGLARGVVGVTAVVMLWLPAARVAYELVPGMNVMYPYARFTGWLAVGLVVAAMVGVDVVADALTGAIERRRGAAASTDEARKTLVRARWGLAATVCLLALVQLVPLGRAINPAFQQRDDAAWYPPTPVVDAARELPDHDGWEPRLAPVTTDYEGLTPGGPPILWANHGVMLGLDNLSGYDSTLPEPAAQLLRSLAGDDPAYVVDHPLVGAYVPVFELTRSRLENFGAGRVDAVMVVPEVSVDDPALAALGPYRVAHEGPDGSLLVLETPRSGPYLAESLVVAGPEPLDTLTATLENADRPGVAVVEESVAGQLGDAAALVSEGRVETVDRGVNSLELTVSTQGSGTSGLLVLPVNSDPGWSASVDGVDVDVAEVNHAHMGVVVPSGDSVVELRYRPPFLVLGAVVTAAAAVALCGVAWWDRRRRSSGSVQRPAAREVASAGPGGAGS